LSCRWYGGARLENGRNYESDTAAENVLSISENFTSQFFIGHISLNQKLACQVINAIPGLVVRTPYRGLDRAVKNSVARTSLLLQSTSFRPYRNRRSERLEKSHHICRKLHTFAKYSQTCLSQYGNLVHRAHQKQASSTLLHF
jgi:hypothetical protein